MTPIWLWDLWQPRADGQLSWSCPGLWVWTAASFTKCVLCSTSLYCAVQWRVIKYRGQWQVHRGMQLQGLHYPEFSGNNMTRVCTEVANQIAVVSSKDILCTRHSVASLRSWLRLWLWLIPLMLVAAWSCQNKLHLDKLWKPATSKAVKRVSKR